LACSGARPLAVTDCLNFGSPERPEILWQFAEAIRGISEACRQLEIPVVSGNVSFYNETEGQAILPTPVIGMVGLLEDAGWRTTQWFKQAGDRIALIGPDAVSLGGSEYLATFGRRLAGRPAPLDLRLERDVQAACRAAIEAGLVSSAHDAADGGVAVALAEACLGGPEALGVEVELVSLGRHDLTLFGEGPSRIVVSVPPRAQRHFESLMGEYRVPWRFIGTVGGERLTLKVGGSVVVSLSLDQVSHAWRNGFERYVA
jgi:phosphoribosylformylglycinamidine synthase